MTKDGRPSLLNDIRYFYGIDRRHSGYLKDHEDAVAFGRRIAWFLNGEGLSLGAYTALYLLLTPSLEPGAIQITDDGGDWWQRYTNIGVPSDFLTMANASELVMRGTVAALKAIRPDLTSVVDHADAIVRSHRENFRFLIKAKQTRRFLVEISSTISDWPQPSYMFVSLTDRSDGAYFEAAPAPLQFYSDAFDLAGKIKVSDASIKILSHQSLGAQLTALRHGGDFDMQVCEFLPKVAKPIMSKIIRRRA